MKLTEYRPPHRTITVDVGVEFTVRGLSVGDIGKILSDSIGEIESIRALIVSVVNGQDGLTASAAVTLGMELIQRVPKVAASIIAMAADEPWATDSIVQMPIFVQYPALEAIGELTFKDVVTFQLILASITSRLGMTSISRQSTPEIGQRSASPNGTGANAGSSAS